MESSLCLECTNLDQQITQQIKRMEIKKSNIEPGQAEDNHTHKRRIIIEVHNQERKSA